MLSRLPNLKRLKIDYNRIREIPEGTFKDLRDLKILNLYGNKIAELSMETFLGLGDSLEYMDLGYNIISQVSRISYPKLRFLNLEKNLISNITGVFNLLTSLQ